LLDRKRMLSVILAAGNEHTKTNNKNNTATKKWNNLAQIRLMSVGGLKCILYTTGHDQRLVIQRQQEVFVEWGSDCHCRVGGIDEAATRNKKNQNKTYE
jgi:hypothetical protein